MAGSTAFHVKVPGQLLPQVLSGVPGITSDANIWNRLFELLASKKWDEATYAEAKACAFAMLDPKLKASEHDRISIERDGYSRQESWPVKDRTWFVRVEFDLRSVSESSTPNYRRIILSMQGNRHGASAEDLMGNCSLGVRLFHSDATSSDTAENVSVLNQICWLLAPDHEVVHGWDLDDSSERITALQALLMAVSRYLPGPSSKHTS